MFYSKELIISKIAKIRSEIGHKSIETNILEIIYDNEENDLVIITPDRSQKSNIIGKGGWVVGRLKEELGLNSIHVISNSDIMQRKYYLKLSLTNLESVIDGYNNETLKNLRYLLEFRLDNIYSFNFQNFMDDNVFNESGSHQAVVALSGGVDSSFSLILAKFLGFNPVAVTVDPGSIVLPKYFHQKIDKLIKELEVPHHYLTVDMDDLIEDSLQGKYHPCGRCSKIIEDKVIEYADKNNISIVIFGDMLSAGSQSIIYENNLIRINLPAVLNATKSEIKGLTRNIELTSSGVYGCPLLYEVHKKYPHMKKFSLQRILRETRAGVLEPGEALDLAWSLFKKGK
ncbi:MAG: 7-cyano-7-deazaguanine synthase [Methanobacteriaceae archaeon]|nr:7-cyano-7-deazaguanine synthase [Methanobacteriaceae archaeon]